MRGTYSSQCGDYRTLDIVALNGGTFIARSDTPGPCPGAGWQLIASPGKRGEKGPMGPRGEKGERAAPASVITGWQIDCDRYLAIPVMSDDTHGPPLELRGLFEQFQLESR